jgi:hypothetical protein
LIHLGPNSEEKVKKAVHVWLSAQLKMFFTEGVSKLVKWWAKCVETLIDGRIEVLQMQKKLPNS